MLQTLRADWRADLRVPPDRRCTEAVALLRELESGRPRESIDAQYDEAAGRWRVVAAGEPVGTLPELPDVGDCHALLSAAPAAGPAAADVLPFAGPEALLETLRTLDDGRPVAEWPVERLQQFATALAYLQLQGLDLLDLDPRFPALVLAFDALATKRSGAVNPRRRALLAHALGYEAAAQNNARQLPETDAIRLFIQRDDAALHERASRAYTDELLNYLVLRRFAQRRDYAGWRAWAQRYTLRDMPFWTVWQTAMLLDVFRHQRFAEVAALMLAAQTSFLAQRDTHEAWLRKLGLDAQQPARALAIVDVLLRRDDFGASLLNEFEGALASWSGRFAGRVANAELVRDYFKAYFYSTVYMAGRHRLDKLGSVPAAKQWHAVVATATTPTGKAYAEWYGQLIAAEEGTAKLEQLLGTLQQPGPLGAEPRRRLIQAMGRYLPYGSHENRATVRAFRRALDSRPRHAGFLANELRERLYELNQSERLYAHAAANQAAHDAAFTAWDAGLRGDAQTLLALLRDPLVPLDDKRYAAKLLEWPVRAEPAVLAATERGLLREGAGDYRTVAWYANRALDRGRPADARAAAEAWLKLDVPDTGLQRAVMSAILSRAYSADQRFADAWRVIEPMIATDQAGVLQQAAWTASRVGRTDEALKLWQRVRERYGTDSIEYLEFLWDQRRHAEAADAIAAWPYPLQIQDWAFKLAPAFHDATRDWPDEDVLAAYAPLRERKVPGYFLTYFPEQFRRDSRHELALKMREGLASPQLGQIELFVESYKDAVHTMGRPKALEWLRGAVPARLLNPSSMVFYKANAPELLWDLIPDPHAGSHPEWVWQIRAMSARRDGDPLPERSAQLHDYYRAATGPLGLRGRYLLGLEAEDAVLNQPWPAPELYEVAYVLALKNQCDGRIAEASEWYQVVLDRAPQSKGEYRWAHDQLFRWYSAGQVKERLPTWCGADKPPTPGIT